MLLTARSRCLRGISRLVRQPPQRTLPLAKRIAVALSSENVRRRVRSEANVASKGQSVEKSVATARPSAWFSAAGHYAMLPRDGSPVEVLTCGRPCCPLYLSTVSQSRRSSGNSRRNYIQQSHACACDDVFYGLDKYHVAPFNILQASERLCKNSVQRRAAPARGTTIIVR